MTDLILSKNKILTPFGLKSIEGLEFNSEIYSFNKNKNDFEVDYITEKELSEEVDNIYQIKTTAGFVYCLADNNVSVLSLGNFNNKFGYEKSISLKPVYKLQLGDYLIQPSGIYGNQHISYNLDLLPIIKDLIKNYEPQPKLFAEFGQIWICRESCKDNALPRIINTKNLINIMAWYVAEGHSKKDCFTRANKDGAKYRSEFSQSLKANLEKVELIRNELLNGNIPAKFQFSKTLYNNIPKEMVVFMSNVMAVLCQSCGCFSKDKHIPNWLMDILLQSISLREHFLYTLSLADGFNTNSRYPGFCSISEKLIEDVITLIQLTGYHYTLQNTKTKTKYITYSQLGTKNALISLGNAKFCKILEINTVKYNTNVYKIKTKNNHNLLVGDYGQILVEI